MYDKNKRKYIKKKNVYHRPWGRYTNLFEGKEFLIKELYVKPKGILSLQKHHHRVEHWLVTQGNVKITPMAIVKPGIAPANRPANVPIPINPNVKGSSNTEAPA